VVSRLRARLCVAGEQPRRYGLRRDDLNAPLEGRHSSSCSARNLSPLVLHSSSPSRHQPFEAGRFVALRNGRGTQNCAKLSDIDAPVCRGVCSCGSQTETGDRARTSGEPLGGDRDGLHDRHRDHARCAQPPQGVLHDPENVHAPSRPFSRPSSLGRHAATGSGRPSASERDIASPVGFEPATTTVLVSRGGTTMAPCRLPQCWLLPG
jgi:hypothetical protein